MVLTAGPTAPTLFVPDEQTWTMSGSDPSAHGLRPVFSLGEAARLLVPEVVPAGLDEALESCLAGLPSDVEIETRDLPGLEGRPVASLFAREGACSAEAYAGAQAGAHGDHDMHGDHHDPHGGLHDMHGGGDDMHADHGDMHGGHHDTHGGHHDMMAIVGEPSGDGLVLVPFVFRFGPLGTPLPGGLAVDVTLDGDVVAEAEVQALLGANSSGEGDPSPPDLLTPLAWALVIEASADGGMSASPWSRLAAVETERAVSHLAWLRAFGRLLGWPLLIDRSARALDGLPPLAHGLAGAERPGADGTQAALEIAAAAAEEVSALVARSRLLRARTGGLGAVSLERGRHAGLRGLAARASGLRDDARVGDALYGRIGFKPVLHTGGDAHARTLVRADEALDSLRLAAAALRADADGVRAATAFPAPGEELEGPRGPLRAERSAAGWQLRAPGSNVALRMGGEAMVGAEWSAALVALASFDLSPWRIEA